MVTIEEFDKIIEEVLKEDLKKDIETNNSQVEFLENRPFFSEKGFIWTSKGISFFELESNISHNFYHFLKKRLEEKGLFPNILINIQGGYQSKKSDNDLKPDMMVIKDGKPFAIMEFKTASAANNNKTPFLPGVEKDIIKLSELYDNYHEDGLERTYMFVFSRNSWKATRKTSFTEEAIAVLKDADHLKFGYGFYEEEKWGFWEHPFDYPKMLKTQL